MNAKAQPQYWQLCVTCQAKTIEGERQCSYCHEWHRGHNPPRLKLHFSISQPARKDRLGRRIGWPSWDVGEWCTPYHNRHIFAAGTAAGPASTGIGLHRRPRAASSRFAPSLEWQNIGTNGQTDDGPMPRTKSEVLTIRTAAEAEPRSAVSMVKVLVLDYVWSAVLDSDRPGRKGSNNAA